MLGGQEGRKVVQIRDELSGSSTSKYVSAVSLFGNLSVV